MEWHDSTCRRLDLVKSGGIVACQACGSFSDEKLASLLPPIRNRTEIRILRLHAGREEDDLRGDIHVADLDSKPHYEAISYTWADEHGDATKYQKICLSGTPLEITGNCYSALKRVRKDHEPRMLWIDAICIDQEDDAERGHQVQLMPRIYSGAFNVLIYIGDGCDASNICLDMLQRSTTLAADETFSSGFQYIQSRPYFRRIWIQQEVALARQRTLICGRKTIFIDRFWQSEFRARLFPSILHYDQPTSVRQNHLLRLLDLTLSCESSDPRDQVYALLGISSDCTGTEVGGGLVPDYRLSTRQVYVKTALCLAAQRGWLAVLSRAGAIHQSLKGLPSWVPDWTSAARRSSLGKDSAASLDDVHSFKARVIYNEDDLSITLSVLRIAETSAGQWVWNSLFDSSPGACDLVINPYSEMGTFLKRKESEFLLDQRAGGRTVDYVLVSLFAMDLELVSGSNYQLRCINRLSLGEFYISTFHSVAVFFEMTWREIRMFSGALASSIAELTDFRRILDATVITSKAGSWERLLSLAWSGDPEVQTIPQLRAETTQPKMIPLPTEHMIEGLSAREIIFRLLWVVEERMQNLDPVQEEDEAMRIYEELHGRPDTPTTEAEFIKAFNYVLWKGFVRIYGVQEARLITVV